MTADNKTTEAFDLAALDTTTACNKPREFEIVHPVTRAPTGIFWSVLGKDSDVYRNKVRSKADENIRRSNAGLGPIDNSLSKLEAWNIDTLVAATTGWRSAKGDETVTLAGKALPFTTENVREVLTKLPVVREQVQEAVNDLSGYLGN